MTQPKQRVICKLIAVTAVLSASGMPALASDAVPVPARCAAVATAHKNGCVATTILQCESGWRALSYRRGSLNNTLHYSAKWDFMKWETEGAGEMDFAIVPGTGSALNLAELAETGAHTASGDFVMNSNIIRGQEYVLTGDTTATGETLTVSGEEFDVYLADRAFARKEAAQVLNFTTEILVSKSRDLVLEGNFSRAVNYGPDEAFDLRPQRIYGPGESGFLATTSEFGCG
ncbi:hypothetical protein [Roseobacter sp.]|uniref:hypothetical protein n=1 Tax=Roseobacter sp. TaxID=1907202 RepID=UPI002967709F|nr:hypothetical protein [Roseobacter sp.]MDW3181482.1 hypothetical protein [Roseobacter sp.]